MSQTKAQLIEGLNINTSAPADALAIDSSGKVGIGTTSPADELHINSTTNVNLRLTRNTNTGARITGTDGGSTPAFIVETIVSGTATERMRIDSSGRLLVGLTSDLSGGTSSTALQIATTGGGFLGLARNDSTVTAGNSLGGLRIYSNAPSGYSKVADLRCEADGTFASSDYPSRWVFTTTADGASSPTERMRIDSSGQVGIGTTSPVTDLELSRTGNNADGLTLTCSDHTNTPRLFFKSTSTNGAPVLFGEDGDLRINTGGTPGSSSGTERMRIDSSGNVGIGTTSPDDILDVRSGASGFSQFVHLSGQGGVRIAGTGASSSANLVFSNNHNSGVTDEYTIQMSGDNDRLAFRSGGTGDTETVSFMADGKVGIGHSSPASLLTVGGDVITTAKPTVSIAPSSGNGSITIRGGSPTLSFDQTGGGDGTILYDSSSDLLFKNGTLDSSSEVARINDSGSLLIGSSVAASAGDAQYAYLQIAGNTAGVSGSVLALKRGEAASQMSDGDSLGTIIFTGTTGGDFASIRGAVDGSPSGSDFPGRITFSVTADGANSPTERMRIDSSGKVGIGTTSPSSLLHLSGNQTALRIQRTSSLGFLYNVGTSSTDATRLQAESGPLELYTNASQPIKFKINGDNEKARIDSNGNFGIGTTNPVRDFHNSNGVCLTTGAAPQYRLNGGAGDSNDNDRAIFGLCTGDNHFFSGTVAGDTVLRTTNAGKLLLGIGTTERFRIASNGRITAQVIYGTPLSGTTRDVFIEDGGQLGYISSVRDSKVNINLLSNVDWLYQLQPSSFNYKLTDQEGAYTGEVNPELEYGLIAEDVEPVAPELCFYDEVDGEQELRGVHYKKLIVPMLKALQEATAKIETLETQNADLLARVTALEAG